ncbi:ureidoglycolate lyase [Acuticoccus sediminis]|uniref:ureidoglycolate lyase n=1 Tax=Acuticoccus sediminis TaxID=2184697 RepID=UPI001CFD4374|nr:ureidoglycolate lyase [Acuticoccus sediminis]
MTGQDLVAVWATPDSFAPYGALVPVPQDGARVPLPETFPGERTAGEPRLAMNAIAPAAGAVPLMLERHPYSVQMFVPLGEEPLLAVVASPDLDRPGRGDLRAFKIPARHAVVYRAGTWHLGMAALTGPTAVAVFIRRMADGRDTEFFDLQGVAEIVV